jgi:uncharacterized RDD family membrane protein YckC
MDWYYAVTDGKVGPVPQEEFAVLVQAGKIGPDTKVWHDGMVTWALYSDLAPAGAFPVSAAPGLHRCAECGVLFPEAEMIAFEHARVCTACKPVFVQKLKEGIAPPSGPLNYAGFWIRTGAYLIDYIILQVVNFFVVFVLMAAGLSVERSPAEASYRFRVLNGAATLLIVGIGILYFVFFNGAFGATPGKLCLKLKIVRSDGKPITYLRAFARYFALLLSSLFLGIGLMMAGWDSEKRAMHDSICDTRVIRR